MSMPLKSAEEKISIKDLLDSNQFPGMKLLSSASGGAIRR